MSKVKFNQLSKKDKIFKIVNLCIMAVLFVASLSVGIYKQVTGLNKSIFTGIAIGFYFLIPYIFELVFRTRLSNVLFLGIEIYLFFAGFLGSVLSFYSYFSWYDIVVHTCMGYFVSMLGIFIISRLTEYKKISPIAVAFFCLIFSLGVELVWEISEYIVDLAFGLKMQGPKMGVDEYGNLVPLVSDTIIDLCCNFTGSFLFFLHFIIGKFTKHSLGINTIETELAKGLKENYYNEKKIDFSRVENLIKCNKKYLMKIAQNSELKCKKEYKISTMQNE